jgi:hypothetical protein
MNSRQKWFYSAIFILIFILVACEASAEIVVPTEQPTASTTFTPAPSQTQGANVPPTITQRPFVESTGGPSPTPLFGSTRTSVSADFPTPTRPFNPNAPRIDFFTSDPLSVAPGAEVTLFWSTRNVDSAVIYRLDRDGVRSQVYNISSDGNLAITTSRSERGTLRFALAVGEGADYLEQEISIALECPDLWFFSPAPLDCATGPAIPTRIVDIELERGRMLYIEETDKIYALFNDGLTEQATWLSFDNRFDPELHPSRDENAPPEWIQPIDELGFVWRGDSDVRNRLGLGLRESVDYEGLIQTAPASRGQEVLYISASTGVVLQIIPGNEVWQIIGG